MLGLFDQHSNCTKLIFAILPLCFKSIAIAQGLQERKPMNLSFSGKINSFVPEKIDITWLTSNFKVLQTVKNVFVEAPTSIFEGASCHNLINKIALKNVSLVTFSAVNQYTQKIPTADLLKYKSCTLVWIKDSKIIPRTDRGTFRLVFDQTEVEKGKSETYAAYSVWQVVEVKFE
jgi:hypothetical protein